MAMTSTTRRERRRAQPTAAVAPPPRLLALVLLLGAAGLRGANARGLATAAPVAGAPTMELVDASGKLASASEITSLLSGFGGKAMNVVGVLGSKGSGKSTLLNQAFGTSFSVGGPLSQGAPTAGVSAATCDGVLLLDCDGLEEGADPTAISKGTTAGQATAFSAALSDVVLMNLWRSDLGRSVASNVRTIKTLFSEKLQEIAAAGLTGDLEEVDSSAAAAFRPTPVVVAVHDCDPGADTDALEWAVMEEMLAVWREVDHPSGATLQECFDIQVLAIPHPRYHAVAYATAIEALKQKLQTMEASTATAGFRDRVTRAWQAVRDAGATMIPAKSEMVALYKVDSAYGEVMGSADMQLKSWRQTVGAGRVVGDFGERSTKLYRSSVKAFDTKTVRFSTSATRATKRAALLSTMETGIKELYARQLSMLCARALKSYKAALMKLLGDDVLNEESEANVLRQTLFSFEADATSLVPDMFSLGFEDEYEELEADLQEFSEKFADSPAAQAKAVQKVDTKVQKPKGERSVGFGLGLVGMVRQEGYGNLQGFTGYRAGPHTITMGYANDASLPDASGGAAGKVPLLRLQPKLNVDIDL
ncbi:unnamed protein product [Ectocarpus sp. 6 AP-2014]